MWKKDRIEKEYKDGMVENRGNPRNMDHQCRERSKKAFRICKQKKNVWMREKMLDIEDNSNMHIARKFYMQIKKQKRVYKVITRTMKDIDGKLKCSVEKVEVWKTHFETLLNRCVERQTIHFNEHMEEQDNMVEKGENILQEGVYELRRRYRYVHPHFLHPLLRTLGQTMWE